MGYSYSPLGAQSSIKSAPRGAVKARRGSQLTVIQLQIAPGKLNQLKMQITDAAQLQLVSFNLVWIQLFYLQPRDFICASFNRLITRFFQINSRLSFSNI
jgi:hypothetical protein